MALASLVKITATDPQLQRVQENVATAIGPVLASAILGGVLLEGLTVSASGSVTVDHGLKRQPRGWVVVDQNLDANLWRTAWSDRTLTLSTNAASTLTFSLYVF